MPNNADRPPHVQYTAEFKRNIRMLSRKYRHIRSDVQPFIDEIEAGQIIGNQIKGVGYTIYKARIRNYDIQKGKSAGYRIIYWLKTPQNIILVTIYSKLDQADISPKQIRLIVKQEGGAAATGSQTTPVPP